MPMLYWIALVVGGGMLAAALLGDLSDTEGDGSATDAHAVKILSLRNFTYFLFGFGATGVALRSLLAIPELLVAIIAVGVGALSAGIAALLLGYVARTSSGEVEDEESFVGCAGRIVLPIGSGSLGRVVIKRGAREYELRARAFDSAATKTSIGSDVVVVDMADGTALVTPLESFTTHPAATPETLQE